MTFVWGVDVAVTHVSFGFAAEPTGPITVDSIYIDSEFGEGQRLGLLDRQIRIRARQLADQYPPTVIWVEQPATTNARGNRRCPEPQLMYAVGVVQAALFETFTCPVWTVPIPKWKQWSVGSGNANKERVRHWVTDQGGECNTQDEFDAYAIAYGGREMLNLKRWDKAA